jgi:hypothetical protein
MTSLLRASEVFCFNVYSFCKFFLNVYSWMRAGVNKKLDHVVSMVL